MFLYKMIKKTLKKKGTFREKSPIHYWHLPTYRLMSNHMSNKKQKKVHTIAESFGSNFKQDSISTRITLSQNTSYAFRMVSVSLVSCQYHYILKSSRLFGDLDRKSIQFCIVPYRNKPTQYTFQCILSFTFFIVTVIEEDR